MLYVSFVIFHLSNNQVLFLKLSLYFNLSIIKFTITFWWKFWRSIRRPNFVGEKTNNINTLELSALQGLSFSCNSFPIKECMDIKVNVRYSLEPPTLKNFKFKFLPFLLRLFHLREAHPTFCAPQSS